MSWDHDRMMEFCEVTDRLGQLLVEMADQHVLDDERIPVILGAELKLACTMVLQGLTEIMAINNRSGVLNAFYPYDRGASRGPR